MKKIFLLAIILITGCSREATHPTIDIYGTWGHSSDIGEDAGFENISGKLLHVDRYIFKKDHSFESFTFVMDEDSYEILGFRSRSEGTFSKQGNRLNLNYNMYSSYNAENDFTLLPKEDLSLVGEDIDWEFNYTILDNKSILKFDFDPCGPAENCVGGMTLVRVK
jgi:hypothetical protein